MRTVFSLNETFTNKYFKKHLLSEADVEAWLNFLIQFKFVLEDCIIVQMSYSVHTFSYL